MAKLSINSFTTSFFKTASSEHEVSRSNHTNPFGVSFKGNMITADVFDCSKKEKVSFTGLNNVAERTKMLTSALVGSINSFKTTRLDSIIRLGQRIRENVLNAWKKAQSIEISFDVVKNITNSIKERVPAADKEYLVDNLMNLPARADLMGRFENEIALMRENA